MGLMSAALFAIAVWLLVKPQKNSESWFWPLLLFVGLATFSRIALSFIPNVMPVTIMAVMVGSKFGAQRGISFELDFSCLSYDSSSDTLWIVCDKGRCLIQYDWAGDTVLQRLDLTISTGDKPQRIRKPEGVAFDPGRKRIYVVSDRDADLYVFKLHDDC